MASKLINISVWCLLAIGVIKFTSGLYTKIYLGVEKTVQSQYDTAQETYDQTLAEN